MTGNLQPLYKDNAIVDPATGKPNDYFIRWAQQRQIDITDAITAAQALEIVEQFLADHPLIAGSGIGLSPSGDIGQDVTISAQVQAVLNQISNTHGTVLFRGATDWQALAPGTSGQFFKTNGAAADPEWAAAGGGGAGALSLISTVTTSASQATVTFSSIPGTFKDLILVVNARGTASTTAVNVLLRMNGDTGANYSYERVNPFGSTFAAAGTSMEVASINAATALANRGTSFEAAVFNYADTLFHRQMTCFQYMGITNTASNFFQTSTGGFWNNTTNAITQLDVFLSSGAFLDGSIASLYGRG